jgi:D-psicose/D-tagatose/L-ribulose 3-epimerase
VQIGCHGLVWTGTYDADGIRRAVTKTRQAGFDLIEFPLMDPFTFDVATARNALDDNGIAATGSLGLSTATDISSEDDDAVRAGEDLLNRAVDVLAELGAATCAASSTARCASTWHPPRRRGSPTARR